MKVLCINSDFSNAIGRPSYKYLKDLPKELEEYTVREVVEKKGIAGYLLEEIFGGTLENGEEISYDSSRFIPIQDDLVECEEMEMEECYFNKL